MADKRAKRWIPVARWTARTWSLGPILWSLAEMIFPHSEPEVEVFWYEWLALSIMGVAVFGLAIAWRWERLGGWVTLAALVVFTPVFLITVERSVPAIFILLLGVGIPAGLFILCNYFEVEVEVKMSAGTNPSN